MWPQSSRMSRDALLVVDPSKHRIQELQLEKGPVVIRNDLQRRFIGPNGGVHLPVISLPRPVAPGESFDHPALDGAQVPRQRERLLHERTVFARRSVLVGYHMTEEHPCRGK